MVWSAQKLEAIMPDTSQLLSEEPEMESSLHYMQLLMLVTCLEWLWRDQTEQLAQQLRRCEAACLQTSLGVDPDTLA